MTGPAARVEGEIELRTLRPDELDAYFAFLRRCLPGAERVIEMYRWRRDFAPVSGGVTTLVAVVGERIVGAQSTGAVDLTCRGDVLSSAYHLDTIVDGDMRGRGLGKKLTLATAAPWAVTMAKGTQPTMYALRKRIGFSDVPRSTVLIRSVSLGVPLSARRAAMHLASRAKAALMWPLRSGRGTAADFWLSAIDAFDESFDALEQRSRQSPLLRPAKPAPYLNWRYATCPGRTYGIYRLDDSRGLRGAAVVRWPEPAGAVGGAAEPEGQAWLVDLIAVPGDRAALRALLGHVVRLAPTRGARTLRAFATAAGARAALGEYGFIDTRYSPRFTYILGRGAPELPYDELDWDFWHGDADTEFYG